jgi:hypothetical protein
VQKKRSTRAKKTPTQAQLKKRIAEVRAEWWKVEKEGGAEYCLRGLRLADLKERYWLLRADQCHELGDRDGEVAATRFALKFGERRASMAEKVKNDILPKLEKQLEERRQEGARLQAIPKRRVTH